MAPTGRPSSRPFGSLVLMVKGWSSHDGQPAGRDGLGWKRRSSTTAIARVWRAAIALDRLHEIADRGPWRHPVRQIVERLQILRMSSGMVRYSPLIAPQEIAGSRAMATYPVHRQLP